MSSAHPHAESMALYAADAAETDEPWERWEGRHPSHSRWTPLRDHPQWTPVIEYRRKPRVRNLNGFEYPEPERTVPGIRGTYWFPLASGAAKAHTWADDEVDRRLLRHGMVHLTKERAEAHALAIIKAGGGEP